MTAFTFWSRTKQTFPLCGCWGSLSVLHIPGRDVGKGKVEKPLLLKGLPLRQLSVYFTQVSDLSPLQGMKPTYLDCNSTFVSDLSPLKTRFGVSNCLGTTVDDIGITAKCP